MCKRCMVISMVRVIWRKAMNLNSLKFHEWQRFCMMLERLHNSFKRI